MPSNFLVILIVPEFLGARGGAENLGISYIEAVLNQVRDTSCWTINKNCTLNTSQILDQLSDTRPDIIGVSATSQNFLNNFSELASMIRGMHSCPIVVGGHYASFVAPELLKAYPELDICVVGEGERTIVELVARIRNNVDIADLQGIAFRRGGVVVETPPQTKIEDLDSLPIPQREPGLPVYSVAGSRGCYTTCSFCSVPQFFKRAPGRNFRLRTPDSLMEEVVMLKKIGARAISFVDDVFLLPGKRGFERAKAIADFMLDLDMKWAFGCRTPELSREIVEYCSDKGLCNVGLGLESGSERVLERLSKRADISSNRSAIKLCQEYNISIQPYFIMFEPDMTISDLKLNVEFLAEFGLLWPSSALNELDPYPGTTAFYTLASRDRLKKTSVGYEPIYEDEAVSKIRALVKREIRPLLETEFVLRKIQFESELDNDKIALKKANDRLLRLSNDVRSIFSKHI